MEKQTNFKNWFIANLWKILSSAFALTVFGTVLISRVNAMELKLADSEQIMMDNIERLEKEDEKQRELLKEILEEVRVNGAKADRNYEKIDLVIEGRIKFD